MVGDGRQAGQEQAGWKTGSKRWKVVPTGAGVAYWEAWPRQTGEQWKGTGVRRCPEDLQVKQVQHIWLVLLN